MNEHSTVAAGSGDSDVRVSTQRKEILRRHVDRFADRRQSWINRNRYFHDLDIAYLRFLVPAGARVLDLGCGIGNVLAALAPSLGVGVDLSERCIEIARESHPELEFVHGDVEDDGTLGRVEGGPFDYIILSDTVGHLEDCQSTLESLHELCHGDTRIIIGYFSHIWQPVLWLAERLGLRMPQVDINYLEMPDIANIAAIAGFDVVKQEQRVLMPCRLLGLGNLVNNYVAPLPLVNRLGLRHYTVMRSLPHAGFDNPSATVIIPCRNERGNVRPTVRRIPAFSAEIEVLFVEGHSQDGTAEEIVRLIEEYDGPFTLRMLTQDGVGKGDAVRKGFDNAHGEVLMILDADLTVAPEDLDKFYRAIVSGQGEFINGSRMVYPMESNAMRTLNLIANAVFARLFLWLLNQRITDTLCGTKVLTRASYRRIAAGRAYFGDFDPFGDFDLLFGASRANLKILEIPVRYARRGYGTTQISRFRHGWHLLRMVLFAYRKLKVM